MTPQDAIAYLLQRNLLSTRAIVDSDLVVLDVSRRNHSFKLISKHFPSYFLKQGVLPDQAVTIAREAALYEHFHFDSRYRELRPYLPDFQQYDDETQILILSLLPSAQTMRE